MKPSTDVERNVLLLSRQHPDWSTDKVMQVAVKLANKAARREGKK